MNLSRHIIISPHLDDAVLSCGELIKHLVSSRETVLVATIFTGFPPPDDLSDAAKQYHLNCFLGDDSMLDRRSEDYKAMEYLGCKYKHLNYYECLYRKDSDGTHIYPDLKSIYNLNFERELKVFHDLCVELKVFCESATNIYAPFGLGNHADHLLIRKVFDSIKDELNATVFFYEEIPYICYYYEAGGNPNFEKILSPTILCFSESAWQAKIDALRFYKSQLHIMWRTEDERQEQLVAVSKKYNACHSIRLWR